MPRFVHIDHCLCHVGGHEYDYADNVLRAAESAGYEVVLATNRRFHEAARFPKHWPVHPIFPHTAYTKHCAWYGGHSHLPMGLAGEPLSEATRDGHRRSLLKSLASGIAQLTNLRRRRHRHRLIRGFACACQRLFEHIPLGPLDHVFLATATEFDLLGLARYFAHNPPARRANWHLQFHFGLYGGCPPEASARAERRQAVQRQFEFALQHLPRQTVRFYSTTEQLAAQYDQLNVGRFQYMPFAVSPALQSTFAFSEGGLRVTCAGAARRDKRIHELRHVAQAVRSDPFFDRKIEIVAQMPNRKRRRLGIPTQATENDRADVPFITLPHPLERDAYHELICQTDIGLFLHDKRRYYAQCSGVLHEMLAAGKPVIVPGGCWLASQIAEPIFTHIETLCATLPTVGCLTGDDVRWRKTAGNPGRHLGGDGWQPAGSELLETQLIVPPAATELVVKFRWPDAPSRGQYLNVQLEQTARDGKGGQPLDCIVGRRRGDGPALAIFHLDSSVDQITLRIRNAQENRRIAVSDVQIQLLRTSLPHGCPAGSVGLIAAQPSQAALLLRDMVQHYAHYRDSAIAFSRTWRQAHDPSQTIDMLTGGRTKGLLAA
jgi:hypothetical protein